MKKRLFNGAVIILLIAIFVQCAGYIVRPLDTDSSVAAIKAFQYLPEDSIEVIGFGSSHIRTGLDPSVMYEEYGIGAYNYGTLWQKSNTTSLFIQDALRTQSPKVILVEALHLSYPLWNKDMTAEVYYTRAIDNFEGKQRYLKQCFGDEWERYLSYYMPLCAFHDNWVNISKSSFCAIGDGSENHKTLGFRSNDKVMEVTLPDPQKLPQREFGENAFAELQYIVDICRSHDVQIVFYVAPYAGEFAYGDATARFAAEYGYPFINMFELTEEIGIDGSTDFFDTGHLNNSGARKVARYLGAYLKEHYDLTDMRQIEGNFWEKQLSS